MKAWIVTLGCPKNLVDSEAALTLLRGAGCDAAGAPDEADLLVVNACSFLESSWRETLGEVDRLAGMRRAGQRVILMGCLPRHRKIDLEKEIPEVDFFVPSGAHGELPRLIRDLEKGGHPPVWLAGDATDRFVSLAGRDRLTVPHVAYVKVAEGCNRSCSFCAIPAIRGRQQARAGERIVAEVQRLVEDGVKEISLLAQDIVSWRDGTMRLPELIDELAATGMPWIRIFYVHPAGVDAASLERLFVHPSVCRYLEMPVQHISTRILSAMRRGYGRDHVETLLRTTREQFPDVVIRSEVIVGYPGETEEEFEELKRFVEEISFDSLGVFPYSPEPGTVAGALASSGFDHAMAHDRANELSELQEAVACGARSRFIGRALDVLVDRELPPGNESGAAGYRAAGRFYGQAPEVDGEVYVRGTGITPGEFVSVQISDAGPYDLMGSRNSR